MRERKRSGEGVEGEADSQLSREPDEGLNPKTPGSQPKPKKDAQPMSNPGTLTPLTFIRQLQVLVLESLPFFKKKDFIHERERQRRR